MQSEVVLHSGEPGLSGDLELKDKYRKRIYIYDVNKELIQVLYHSIQRK